MNTIKLTLHNGRKLEYNNVVEFEIINKNRDIIFYNGADFHCFSLVDIERLVID